MNDIERQVVALQRQIDSLRTQAEYLSSLQQPNQNLSTGNSPTFGGLTLGAADATDGAATFNRFDTADATVLNGLVLNRTTSHATPAPGLGVATVYQIESTTSLRTAHEQIADWDTATDASRKARVRFNVYDTASREALRLQASGSAAMIGFLGAGAVARPTAYTQTYSTATRTHSNITAVAPSAYAGGANGYSTAAKAQEVRDAAAALVADIANVKQVLNQVIDDLQSFGLLG